MDSSQQVDGFTFLQRGEWGEFDRDGFEQLFENPLMPQQLTILKVPHGAHKDARGLRRIDYLCHF